MRFDDSLDTVMAAEMAGPAGIQSAWRQLVDLIGRRRGGPPEAAIGRLRQIRDDVPLDVRIASARGLERAYPPAALVALFAADDATVATPVVRSARLTADEWIALLPRMQPTTRGVLRHRRDLSARVLGALESFGSTDFGLPPAPLSGSGTGVTAPVEAMPEPDPSPELLAEASGSAVPDHAAPAMALASAPTSSEALAPPPAVLAASMPDPVALFGEAEQALPVLAETETPADPVPPPPADVAPPGAGFAIAELVARIEAHRRVADAVALPPALQLPVEVDVFRFETDAEGRLRWCDHHARGALIGLPLAARGVDGAIRGAFARRAAICDARLEVGGEGSAAGAWRISALPAFERASGRFTGYRGTARRPRADEQPRLALPAVSPDADGDSLRQLVHELRTPANAISGFAEMIERELLGPVPAGYRDQAAAIRRQTGGLLDAIEDLDTAARIETRRLDLRPEAVPLIPLLQRVMAELQALADLRGTFVTLDLAEGLTVRGDARALERLFSRLLTALVSSAVSGEVLAGTVTHDGDALRFDIARPKAFIAADGQPLSGDAELEQAAEGAPLLGAGFAFRLARGLAKELGGGVVVEPERLTLRLPAAVRADVEQATV